MQRLAGVALTAVVLLPAVSRAWAGQGEDRNPRGDRSPAAQGRQDRQAGLGLTADERGKEAFIKRLSALPPDQQEKVLKSSPVFQKMPPAQQQRIVDALRHWNAAGRPPGALRETIEHQHAPGFFQELREMPPEEQERVMQNDQRFQSLAPERQQQIRENLSRWNAATPDERKLLEQREEILQSFSPEQRDQLRQVFPRYRQLPPDQRQAVMQAFSKLRDLPAGERDKFMAGLEVQQLSPEARGVVGDLKSLLPQK
jgi:DNA-directed RNA polymerase subunit F